jgi:hypothetical protein
MRRRIDTEINVTGEESGGLEEYLPVRIIRNLRAKQTGVKQKQGFDLREN